MRSLAVLVTAALLLLAPAAAVAAAEPTPITLSRDGRTWSADLSGSVLVDAPERWSPGDSATGHFFVRNDARTRGSLSIGLEAGEPGSSSALLDSLTLRATAGGATLTRAADEPAAVVAELEPGDVLPVRLTVHLAEDADNSTQELTESLRVQVRLTGPGGSVVEAPQVAGTTVSLPSGSGATATTGSSLPATGNPVTLWMVGSAVLAVGVGSGLLAGRRRRAS